MSLGEPATMRDTMRGRLLVATPALGDPNFAHTVVFLLDHGDEGAIGVVINRPSETEVATALPKWESLAARPALVFVGGPVQPEAVVAVGHAAQTVDAVQPICDGVGVVDLRVDPLELLGSVSGVRLFAGYAGWGEGQLEAEIADGGWFLIDAAPSDVLTTDPDALWVSVLSRQGGLFTTISEDPTLN